MNENRVAEYLQSCEEKLRISNEKCECFQKELEVQINTNQALNKAFDQSKKKSEECKAKLTSKNQLLKKSKDEISNAEIRQNSLRKKIINLEEKLLMAQNELNLMVKARDRGNNIAKTLRNEKKSLQEEIEMMNNDLENVKLWVTHI